ncbi:MAG: ABC transporter ATP-binding protein [Oscillospiraceae bacterium]|nr:ABC transporter ATP-binding protein [Oscillospiraceae bacterium]
MSIEVKDLRFSYGEREVLKGISFKAERGEFLSILGANGVGKSTLFRCVLGLLKSYRGEVLIDGVDARSFSVREAAKHIAYIPQKSHPAFNFSVFDIVLMGTTSGLSALSSPSLEDCERVDWALEKTGISSLARRCFHKLSGGEQQLAMIARALVQRAPLLMLDEPTASLDFSNQLLVLSQARALAAEGYTVIQTTHNPEQSYMYSDRILALKDGLVLAEGSPAEVLTSELMASLYGADVQISSLFGDRVRVCTPKSIL